MPKRKQLNIRMTESLRRRIEADAKKRGVSINSELVRRLEHSFAAETTERALDVIVATINVLAEHIERPDLKIDTGAGGQTNDGAS